MTNIKDKDISNSLMNFIAIVDFIALNCVFIFFLKESNDYSFGVIFRMHYRALLFVNLAWILSSITTKLYKSIRFTTMVQVVKSSIQQLVILSLFFFTLSGLRKDDILSLKHSFILLAIVGVYIIITRILVLSYAKRYRIKGKDIIESFVIGLNNQTLELVSFLNNSNQYGYRLLGVFTDKKIEFENLEVQSLSNLKDRIKRDAVKEVFVCTNQYLSHKKLTEILKLLNDNFIKINIIPDFDSVLNLNLKKNYINYLPVYSSEKFVFEKSSNRIVKRGFDILFSISFIIFIASWTFPIFALITKLTSKGPILFLQERIGINGKVFKIIKFRSMKIDAENDGPQLSNGDGDSRITKWGKIMRKYRIDELPQFINVLNGDMSIVGPLKNYSIVMDLKIIFLTIVVVIKGKGK